MKRTSGIAQMRHSIRQVRHHCYRIGSVLGDVNALLGGPRAVSKRVVRKTAWRETTKVLRRVLR